MKPTFRLILVLAALPVVAIVLVQQFRRLLDDPTILPIDDFVEYWAAGRLNAQGKDPYDPDKLLPLEVDAGRKTDEAIMMWNPPWTLTLAMPFGLMESRAAQLLWIGLGLFFIVAGADVLWRLYGGPAQWRWVPWLMAITFLPTLFVLNSGQIGTWVLAGSVLFLFCQQRGWSLLAGASTVLLAIKPHLVYLFWIALIVWGIRRDRRLLLGGLIAGIIATAIPVVCNPHVLQQYWEAMTLRPPAQWKSPTLGSVIRMVAGESTFGLTFLPTLLGLGWLAWHTRRASERVWDWCEQMPLLLLVSFVTASYGAWPFDLVILLPAAIQIAAAVARANQPKLLRRSLLFWFLFNLAALILNLMINVPALQSNAFKVDSFWFIWMAPVMLLAYLLLMRHLSLQARRKELPSRGA